MALHALNRLQGGKIYSSVLSAALTDEHPRVLAHAIRLAGQSRDPSAFQSQLLKIQSDDANVQLALAMAADRLPSAAKSQLLCARPGRYEGTAHARRGSGVRGQLEPSAFCPRLERREID